MNAMLLLTTSGALVFLTSYPTITDAALLERLQRKGIGKFISFEIPIELVRQRYGGHFAVVAQTLDEVNGLRMLDLDGQRAFKLFRFDELQGPIVQDGAAAELMAVA
ncbi:Cytosolic protein [Rhodovastum atsumiense]|uniref:Cytosolic protein n=1 Tax=Rhodovastum atsumiense TaxID=504468 RepID=A0A5M6IR90_9PROT|nr:cytosolic protein [Rhodovastum atsumiense]KAA5610058.1 cytosolic protein [Rhodovastum atsumiense]CAH2602944.1 Cytosolic protein [Rhodovastum atsumiense]